jgi:hypothetical protein
LCANPFAIAARVFMLHGAITIPPVRNEPLETLVSDPAADEVDRLTPAATI